MATQSSFADRIARVEARAPQKEHVAVLPDWKANLREPVAILAAAAIGAVACAVAIIALGRPTAGFGAVDLVGASIAVALGVLGFFVAARTGWRSTLVRIAPAVGAVTTAALIHNAVHATPAVFAKLAGSAWTAQVVETTRPSTVNLAGASFTLGSDTEEEVAVEDAAAPVAQPARPKVGFGNAGAAPAEAAPADAAPAEKPMPTRLRMNNG